MASLGEALHRSPDPQFADLCTLGGTQAAHVRLEGDLPDGEAKAAIARLDTVDVGWERYPPIRRAWCRGLATMCCAAVRLLQNDPHIDGQAPGPRMQAPGRAALSVAP